jgi:hypothetical protein
VNAILRDTLRYRHEFNIGGVLDNYRQIPREELMARDYPLSLLSNDELKPLRAVRSIEELKAMSWDKLRTLRDQLAAEGGTTE